MATSTKADPQLCVDTIRTLSMDAVQQANSGHPGLPMGMAPAAYLLFAEVMRHDPKDPQWPDRDRFILSAGHGSMLLYSVLHLAGYDLSLDDLKSFRKWGSLTPGHPERDRVHVTPGVEVTTGPLGQGFANGVGMAMAERFLRERYGSQIQNHHVYAIVSDGDLMEGVAAEAASLAGQLGLGRLVYLYDDNDVTLDGPASLSFTREDRAKRFESYGWHTLTVEDANDLDELRHAVAAGQAEQDRPTLISVKSIIGFPSPQQGTSEVHGKALGEENVRASKEAMGWDPDKTFHVPEGVYDGFGTVEKGEREHAEWTERFEAWRSDQPDLAAEWDSAWAGRPMAPLSDVLPKWDVGESVATRSAGGKVMAAFEPCVPTMVGGAADLSESTKTLFPKSEKYTAEAPGRNVFFGVREHAMGAAVNGMAAHGGIVLPYGSTFLQFADYMRGAIRLSALTGLHVAWVFTHDSVALGEDGPTHQPVEHHMALRAIPGLVYLRPADANETAEAWRVMLEDLEGPAALALSRQNLPVLDRSKAEGDVGRGAYVLVPGDGPTIVATGSEVWVAVEAAAKLGGGVRVVSMPSWELFEQQDDAYRQSVLSDPERTVSVEAGISLGWDRYARTHVAIDRFGASAPGTEVLERLGINVDNVVDVVRGLL